MLRVTRELRRLIADGRPTGELRDAAARAGLLDLRRAALLKVARGQTNAEEVLRAIPPEELGLDELDAAPHRLFLAARVPSFEPRPPESRSSMSRSTLMISRSFTCWAVCRPFAVAGP